MVRTGKLCQRDYMSFSKGGDRTSRSYWCGALLRLCCVETIHEDFCMSCKEGDSDEEDEINLF